MTQLGGGSSPERVDVLTCAPNSHAAADPVPPPRATADQRETLLQLVSEGMTKRAACEALGIPPDTVTSWIVRDEAFGARWRQARIEQAHSLADEALAIADEDVHGDMAAVQRNRLRVDTRKWLTSKIAPKLYGERITNDHTHKVGVVVLPGLAAMAAMTGKPEPLRRVRGGTRARASLEAGPVAEVEPPVQRTDADQGLSDDGPEA